MNGFAVVVKHELPVPEPESKCTEQELIAQEVAPEIEKKVLQATDTVTVEAPPVK